MNRIATTAAATIIGGFALLAMTACQAGVGSSGVPAQASVLAGQIASAAGQTGDNQGVGSVPDSPSVADSPSVPDSTSDAPSVADSPSPAALPNADAPAGPIAIGSGAVGPMSKTVAPAPGGLPATAQAPSTSSAPSTAQAPSTSSAPSISSAPSTTSSSTPAPSIVSASISCDYSSSDETYHENLSYEVANATGMALSIDNPGLVGSFGTYDWHGTIEIPNLGCYTENGPQTYTLYTVGGTGPQASKTIVRTGTHTHSGSTSTSSAPQTTSDAGSQLPTPLAASSATASTSGN